MWSYCVYVLVLFLKLLTSKLVLSSSAVKESWKMKISCQKNLPSLLFTQLNYLYSAILKEFYRFHLYKECMSEPDHMTPNGLQCIWGRQSNQMLPILCIGTIYWISSMIILFLNGTLTSTLISIFLERLLNCSLGEWNEEDCWKCVYVCTYMY